MNLKLIKFSLAAVINLLTAITFGYFCFLGANFYTLGDKEKSIILAVIITLLLIITSLGAKLLKQTHHNFKSRFILEIVSLVLFTVLIAYFTFFPFSHYFTVSENENVIKRKLNISITQAKNMYVKYALYVDDRKEEYKTNLESAILTKDTNDEDFVKYGFVKNSITYDKQIESMMKTINFDLLPSNFIAMKNGNSKWLANSKENVDNWKPIGVVDVVNNIKNNSKKWTADLISLSKIRETGEETKDFEYQLAFNEVTKFFTTLGNPTPLSVFFAILAYVLMLLSYFFTGRSSKSNVGFRAIFSKKAKNNSEFDIKF